MFLVRSNHMKKELIRCGCPKKKILVHHGGCDPGGIKPKTMVAIKETQKDKRISILLVARFVEKKGIPTAIKAFYESKKKHNNISLKIIGDGRLKEKIEALIKDLDLEEDVILLGMKTHEEVIKELQKADIFLLSSETAPDRDQEGIPVALMEAMASGLPVLSTYHAGIPELVEDGFSGYLVRENDVNALSKKLNYLIEHPEEWHRLGKNARKKVEQEFNIKTQAKELENIFICFLDKNIKNEN